MNTDVEVSTHVGQHTVFLRNIEAVRYDKPTGDMIVIGVTGHEYREHLGNVWDYHARLADLKELIRRLRS